jgi:hypothetical protein
VPFIVRLSASLNILAAENADLPGPVAAAVALVFSVAASVSAQPGAGAPREPWEDTAVTSIGAEPMHATFVPFAGRDEALRQGERRSPFARYDSDRTATGFSRMARSVVPRDAMS